VTSARSLRVRAPAKLNLFLHVTGRRADGYHTLQTLFQILDIGDQLTLEARDDGELQLHSPGLDVPPQDNLVLRAARALKALPATPGDAGARIRLDKQLPSGGGLGGGSSDAASTLLGLNRLWQLGLSSAELQAIAARLGADVPVFVLGHSAWAEGIGEELTPVTLPPAHYLVIKPACSVATGEIFAHRELTRDSLPITMSAFFAGGSRNDCQAIVRRLHPEVDAALTWLERFGNARLTGTGACVFRHCESEADARRLARQVPSQWQAFVAAGCNRSPALSDIDTSL
jgi:4-diphosphocytidyl-2-C-methyl-D-erythritol kinase